jgi:hypothetical protein
VAAVLALVTALLSGCAAAGLSSGTPGSGADGGSGADAESWLVSTRGSATPSARPRSGVRPTLGPTGGFLPLRTPAPARTPTGTCSTDTFNFARIDGLDVTPGRTSAVLGWHNIGGGNLVEFRLYAISQDLRVGPQRDVGYVVVKPRTPCGDMTATIGNLERGTRYVFSVDAVVIRRSGDGTHAATVARSHPIATL